MSSSADNAPLAVLGAGSWGTALARLLASSGRRVLLWAHRAEHAASLKEHGENRRYLPGITLPPNLVVVDNLDELARDCHDYLMVVPSHAFAATLGELRLAFDKSDRQHGDVTLTWGTKGFEPGTGAQLDSVVQRELPGIGARAIVSGPTFAIEVAQQLPAAMAIAGSDTAQTERLADLYRSQFMRIYPNEDFSGVQTAGAVKNVMAIATGISDGLGLGANARAALITRGLAELVRLGLRLEGRAETFMGLAGVGDLVLTCTDDKSRNRRVGLGLGSGQSIEQVLDDIGQEAEGINTCRELNRRSRELDVPMPVTRQVYEVLIEGKDPRAAVTDLMQREARSE